MVSAIHHVGYVVEAGGRLAYAPDEPTVVWTQAERAKGQAWGVRTVESFHTYGTPPVTDREPTPTLDRRGTHGTA
jgi:hypothetical protein